MESVYRGWRKRNDDLWQGFKLGYSSVSAGPRLLKAVRSLPGIYYQVDLEVFFSVL